MRKLLTMFVTMACCLFGSVAHANIVAYDFNAIVGTSDALYGVFTVDSQIFHGTPTEVTGFSGFYLGNPVHLADTSLSGVGGAPVFNNVLYYGTPALDAFGMGLYVEHQNDDGDTVSQDFIHLFYNNGYHFELFVDSDFSQNTQLEIRSVTFASEADPRLPPTGEIPEPASLALVSVALAGLLTTTRRQKKVAFMQ